MSGRIPLRTVSISNTMRPLFQRTFFSERDRENWDMWLEDDLVHVVDTGEKSLGHGILHIASCSVEVKPGAVLPKKPKRGRPPKKRPVEATN